MKRMGHNEKEEEDRTRENETKREGTRQNEEQ